MRNFVTGVLLVFLAFGLTTACKKGETEPAKAGQATGGVTGDRLTKNVWSMTMKGFSYGTMQFNADGTCEKRESATPVAGTWKLDGSSLKVRFGTDARPTTYTVTVEGANLKVNAEAYNMVYIYEPVVPDGQAPAADEPAPAEK